MGQMLDPNLYSSKPSPPLRGSFRGADRERGLGGWEGGGGNNSCIQFSIFPCLLCIDPSYREKYCSAPRAFVRKEMHVYIWVGIPKGLALVLFAAAAGLIAAGQGRRGAPSAAPVCPYGHGLECRSFSHWCTMASMIAHLASCFASPSPPYPRYSWQYFGASCPSLYHRKLTLYS